MDVSVVIPAHGRERLLIRCLSALGRDRAPFPHDICVVDDGSGLDESAIRHAVTLFCPLTWVSLSKPAGRSAARNYGVAATMGRVVVFLDSDMEVEPGFFAAHRDIHQRHPHTAAVGSIRWPRNGRFHRYIGSRGIAKLRPGDEVPPWYFVTGNASVERADLPHGGPFDETLTGWGGEDLDLGMRLARSGIGFAAVRDAIANHHFDGTLAEHTGRTGSYGKNALPVLIGRYPELRRITRLDLAARPLMKLVTAEPVAGMVEKAAEWLDGLPLPDAVYDYLTFAAYARGWRNRKRP